MKISIITVCYNSASTIRYAMDSVLAQKGINLEYIVIDGGSTDGTLDILCGYGKRIARLVSEPDEGIYDAMNKGITLATGDIIGILNSDDFYVDDWVLSKVVAAFNESEVDCVFGDLDYVEPDDTELVVRQWRSRPYVIGALRSGWHPAHPSFFVQRSVYERFGKFDTQLPIAADYEFMLRVLERYQVSSTYLPEVIVKMRVGGVSNASIINILKANLQCWKAWRRNGLGWSPLPVFKKPFFKLLQKRSSNALN